MKNLGIENGNSSNQYMDTKLNRPSYNTNLDVSIARLAQNSLIYLLTQLDLSPLVGSSMRGPVLRNPICTSRNIPRLNFCVGFKLNTASGY